MSTEIYIPGEHAKPPVYNKLATIWKDMRGVGPSGAYGYPTTLPNGITANPSIDPYSSRYVEQPSEMVRMPMPPRPKQEVPPKPKPAPTPKGGGGTPTPSALPMMPSHEQIEPNMGYLQAQEGLLNKAQQALDPAIGKVNEWINALSGMRGSNPLAAAWQRAAIGDAIGALGGLASKSSRNYVEAMNPSIEARQRAYALPMEQKKQKIQDESLIGKTNIAKDIAQTQWFESQARMNDPRVQQVILEMKQKHSGKGLDSAAIGKYMEAVDKYNQTTEPAEKQRWLSIAKQIEPYILQQSQAPTPSALPTQG